MTIIAFLDAQQFDDGTSRRGAVLVTDSRTEPMEFRCTDVVHPTKLQNVLYGGGLDSKLARLIGLPLLRSLSNKPQLIVVRRPEFLDLRNEIDVPLVQILRNEELANASSVAESDGDDVLQSDGGSFEPVILKPHRRFVADRDQARQLFTETFRSYNILEPFERITQALDLVHQQNSSPARQS